MKPSLNALVGALAGIAVVLIACLTALVVVDKTGAPQVAAFSTALTTIIGALVALIAAGRGGNSGQ